MRSISHHRTRRNSRPNPLPRESHDSPSGAVPAATPTVVLLPGASLMDIRPLAESMTLVRCPGCGATRLFTSGPAGVTAHVAFVHEDDACPIFVRIQAALLTCAAPIGAFSER